MFLGMWGELPLAAAYSIAIMVEHTRHLGDHDNAKFFNRSQWKNREG